MLSSLCHSSRPAPRSCSRTSGFRVLSLGEEAAQILGVDVGRLRFLVILGVALGVGGGVAVSGTIGFIGLVRRIWRGLWSDTIRLAFSCRARWSAPRF